MLPLVIRPDLIETDRRGLVEQAGTAFDKLHAGAIFHVRAVDEILILVAHIDAQLRKRSPAAADHFQAFVQHGTKLPDHAASPLIVLLRELRDTRFVSCLFSDLVAGLGLPPSILLDGGFFRCIFQDAAPGLLARIRRGDLPADLHTARDVAEPEPFVKEHNVGGHPHRDVDVPHYTFQINFWFPLHDLPAENSLLIFPEVYTSGVKYQEQPARLATPDEWGYGRALRRSMKLGDTLLFHSQHFHASPSEAPDLDRLTAELRVAAGCQDDNANVYRRQFWNIASFRATGGASSRTRAERLHPHIIRQPGEAQTAQELFASLFADPHDARVAANLWTREDVFTRTRRLPPPDLLDLADRLRRAPFAEDRQLGFARYLHFHGRRDLARLILRDTLARTTSYFFALEIARLAGAWTFYDIAAPALTRAIALAESANVTLGRYRGDVPDRGWPYIQLLPADAQRAAIRLAAVLLEYMSAPHGRPAPLLDHRLFFPNHRSVCLFIDSAVAFVWSLYVYVPAGRLSEVGLSRVTEGGEERIEGELDAGPIVRDPTGTFICYSSHEMYEEIVRQGIFRPQGGAPGLKASASEFGHIPAA